MEAFINIEKFDWDEGNLNKNWEKHQVKFLECEQLFFNRPLVVAEDTPHSGDEPRYYALGTTDSGRLLFIVFTAREKRIRVISARDMSKKERSRYHEKIKEDTKIQE